MGAFIVAYVLGSFIAVPFLGFHLLRTRRELKQLRGELVARGLATPQPGDERVVLPAAREPRPLAEGGSGPAGSGEPQGRDAASGA